MSAIETPDEGAPEGCSEGESFSVAWRERLTCSVADTVVEQVFADRAGSPIFRDRMRHFVRTHMEAMAVGGGSAAGPPCDVETAAAAFGGWLAEQRIPIGVVQDVYWTGMRKALREWAGAGWTGLGRATAVVSAGLVTQVTQRAMELVERSVTAAKAEHIRITAMPRSGGSLGRHALATEILDGRRDAVTLELEAALGYRLSSTHIAVLIDVSSHEAAERLLHEVAAAVGAGDRLLIATDSHRWAGWLGFPGDPGAYGLAVLRNALRGTGVACSVGGVRYGLAGFRQSFDEARRIEDMRTVLAPRESPVLNFSELALESVLLGEVTAAGVFAADELGELAEQSARAARIRTTLSVWLSCG